MSGINSVRLRGSLFATSSLVAASLAAGLGGLTIIAAPTAAFAINECGNPAANGAAADSFNCAPGVYATGIIYPVTAGDLSLNLQEDAASGVVTTTGGIQIVGAPGNALSITRSAIVAGAPDPSIVNTVGVGIGVISPTSNVSVDLTDPDPATGTIVVSGSTTGIAATTGSAGNVAITLSNGTVTGKAGDGIDAVATKGSITVNQGAATITAVNSGPAGAAIGIAAGNLLSLTPGYAQGGVSLTGTGAISATADYAAEGIQVVADGPISITETGPITAQGGFAFGVVAVASGAAPVNITTSSVTANNTGSSGGDGIFVYSVGAVNVTSGTVATTGANASGIRVGPGTGVAPLAGATKVVSGTVTTTGAGSPGIEVYAHGPIDITSGSITTAGAASTGIVADSDLSTVAITSGNISATGAGSLGIDAKSDSKTVTINTTAGAAINAGKTGISAVSGGAGNVAVTLAGGSVTGKAGDGIDAVATQGSIAINQGAATITAINTGPTGAAIGIAAGNQLSLAPGFAQGGVTLTGTGAINATADYAAEGIQVVADGPISITETGPITAKGGFAFGVVAVASGAAPVNITTSSVTANNTGSSGGDGIFVYSVGAVNVTSGTVATTGANASGIRIGPQSGSAPLAGATKVVSGTITTTGANSPGIEVYAHGPIDITSGAVTTTGAASTGIIAASDLSAVSVTTTGATTATADGIDASSTAGKFTVTSNGSITAANNAIKASGGQGGVVTIGTGAVVKGAGSAALAVIDLTSPAGKAITLNNAGAIRSNNASVAASAGDLAVKATGGPLTVNNTGRIDGRLDLTGATAPLTFNNNAAGAWHFAGTQTLSAGNDQVNNAVGGLIATQGTSVLDFGADTGVAPRDTFGNAGTLVAGETAGPSNLSLTGLETFTNPGAIAFGSLNGGTSSDGETNDRVVMSGNGALGTAFVGTGGRLFMDANLGTTTQTNCAAAVTADCLSLPNGTVTGSTLIRVNNTGTTTGGLNAGIVLVDATGGSIAAGSFTLDPTSPHYVTRGGVGAVDAGLFFYRLVPIGTTQEALVSAPDTEAFQFAQMGLAGSSVWYTTTGGWFDREADLRNGSDLGSGGSHAGVWLKMVGDWTRRSERQTFTSAGTLLTFDTSYNQDTAALIGGVDLVTGGSGQTAWVLGVDGGYVDSNLRFRASPTRADLTGGVVGAYASLISSGWYVDGTVAGNFLTLTESMPTLGALPSGAAFSATGKLNTVGGQVESGYRFGAGGFTVEPFGSLSYVRTRLNNLTVPNGSVTFADTISERGSLGVRVSSTMDMGSYQVKPTLYGRAWDEWRGDSNATLTNPGSPLLTNDRFQGVFGEVGGNLAVFSKGGFSAFANASYKWKTGYSDSTVSVGMRYRF